MGLPFDILDVFTDTPFHGNPLAVVRDADHLSGAQMLAIAREFNLSETVFVLRPSSPVHTAKMRIFTPQQELQFAGHPTIGAAIRLAALRNGGAHESLVLLEEGIGTVRVGVRSKAGQPDFAEFDAPKIPEPARELDDRELISAALELVPHELSFENHVPLVVTFGPSFALVPVANLDVIGKASPQLRHWSAAFEDEGIQGVYVYTRQCLRASSAFHARMFAPDLGVTEDPATGSAAIGFARAIERFDGLPDGTHRRIIEQGFEMERPSTIHLTISIGAGRLTNVRIGGHAVIVASGELAA